MRYIPMMFRRCKVDARRKTLRRANVLTEQSFQRIPLMQAIHMAARKAYCCIAVLLALSYLLAGCGAGGPSSPSSLDRVDRETIVEMPPSAPEGW